MHCKKLFSCPKYTLRNVNDWWQQFGYQYNSSQAVSHEIYDFFCTSFLNLDFAEVFRPRNANSRCTLGSTKTFQKTQKNDTNKLAATQANVRVAMEMLRWGTLQTVNKPRERHKVNTHNDCNFLTCPAVWLRFFLATSLVTFTLHSYKTI